MYLDFIRVLPCPRRACLWDDSILSYISFLLYATYEKIDEYFNEKIYFINKYYLEWKRKKELLHVTQRFPFSFLSFHLRIFSFANVNVLFLLLSFNIVFNRSYNCTIIVTSRYTNKIHKVS